MAKFVVQLRKAFCNALVMQTRKHPLNIVISIINMKIVPIIEPAASRAVGDIYEYLDKFSSLCSPWNVF